MDIKLESELIISKSDPQVVTKDQEIQMLQAELDATLPCPPSPGGAAADSWSGLNYCHQDLTRVAQPRY